jgi:hypothetical protein
LPFLKCFKFESLNRCCHSRVSRAKTIRHWVFPVDHHHYHLSSFILFGSFFVQPLAANRSGWQFLSSIYLIYFKFAKESSPLQVP